MSKQKYKINVSIFRHYSSNRIRLVNNTEHEFVLRNSEESLSLFYGFFASLINYNHPKPFNVNNTMCKFIYIKKLSNTVTYLLYEDYGMLQSILIDFYSERSYRPLYKDEALNIVIKEIYGVFGFCFKLYKGINNG